MCAPFCLLKRCCQNLQFWDLWGCWDDNTAEFWRSIWSFSSSRAPPLPIHSGGNKHRIWLERAWLCHNKPHWITEKKWNMKSVPRRLHTVLISPVETLLEIILPNHRNRRNQEHVAKGKVYLLFTKTWNGVFYRRKNVFYRPKSVFLFDVFWSRNGAIRMARPLSP